MIERASAPPEDLVEAERLGKILDIVEREFLPVEIAPAGCAFMMIPGLSPLTPAMNVPSIVVMRPSSNS